MGLTRERDGRFFTYTSHTTEALFATIALILLAMTVIGIVGDNGINLIISIIIIFGGTILFSQIGAAIDNNFSDDDKKYAFKQGRTVTERIVSDNEVKEADKGKKALALCYDNRKNKHYWYINKKFFSIKKDLTQKQFMAEYKILVSRISTHVYLINQEDSNMYKIGITNSVNKRLSSIQTANPNPLSLMYSGKVNNAKKLEKELHTHFRRQKINREWFRLDPPDVKYVIRRIDEDAYAEPVEQEQSRESIGLVTDNL